jgi:hypothetical protein
MFLSGMVKILRLKAKCKFVMPVNAGIQVRFRFNFQNRLDSGFRRNDGNKSRLPVDELRTPRLGGQGAFSVRFSSLAGFERLRRAI